MLSKFRKNLEPVTNRIGKKFSFLDPNVITVLGLFFPITFVYLLNHKMYIAAFFAIVLSITDTLDGSVARANNKVTKFGGVLDSTLDRVSDFLYISAFSISGLVRWEITFAFLLCTFLISYIRSRAELAGGARFKLDIGIMERTERLFGISVIVFITVFFKSVTNWAIDSYNFYELSFIVLTALSLITVMQRLRESFFKLL